MKYIEGRDGLEGRNGNNNNNGAEERNNSCNTPLIFPAILCDVLVRTRKCCCSVLPCITSSEMANPSGRKRTNSSLVFKLSPERFLGVRKAKPTFPFACSMLKSIASATRRTLQRCPCVSLKLPIQRLQYLLGNIRGVCNFVDTGDSGSSEAFLTCIL